MKIIRSLIILVLISILGTACGIDGEDTSTAATGNTASTTEMAAAPANETSTPKPATPTAVHTLPEPQLPVIGPAPEWQNDTWINTETPLRIADLQGKVVLLEFWTFG
ncbi:MAG: hypothetical protein R3293_16690 [Candidatus Promineifilaceae bacterium]|nr:hypothetical protein [Candidatus Promineifilaceae bacterium]